METILWLTLLVAVLVAAMLTLYFHLIHEDLDRGAITAYEITESLARYHPIETGVHFFVSVTTLAHGDLWLAALNGPLLFINLNTILRNEYKLYALTSSEYACYAHKNTQTIKVKLGYYLILFLVVFYKFLGAFSSMMAYRLFG
jgi:hypothetical protein